MAPDWIRSLPDPTSESPWRVLASACFVGHPVGVEATSYGDYPSVHRFFALPNVVAVPACAEFHAFGAPRRTPDIHGGDGYAVLGGRARVLADDGEDWTEGMIRGAQEVLRIARENQVDFALLMDISAACGSTVIYSGYRRDKVYQRGKGVTAALLAENGIPVISQRDFATLELLYARHDPSNVVDHSAIDHRDSEWFRTYFADEG